MLIADIFYDVKRRFIYITDFKQYGVIEKWVMPGNVKFKGDCEDFALACRRLCRENKIDSRLIICLTEADAMHCVLESDGLILDNRMNRPMKIAELQYRWIAMSGYEAGDDWRVIRYKLESAGCPVCAFCSLVSETCGSD